jgi:hypothetical protein
VETRQFRNMAQDGESQDRESSVLRFYLLADPGQSEYRSSTVRTKTNTIFSVKTKSESRGRRLLVALCTSSVTRVLYFLY